MRLTRTERKAVLMVAAATAAVVVSGVKLLKRHTDYMVKKAAAFFKDEKDQADEMNEADETNEADVKDE